MYIELDEFMNSRAETSTFLSINNLFWFMNTELDEVLNRQFVQAEKVFSG